MTRYECTVFDRTHVRANHADQRVFEDHLIHVATDFFHWLHQNGCEWREHINCQRKRGWISYHIDVPQNLIKTYEATWVEQRDGVVRETPKAPPQTPAPFPKPRTRTFETTYFPGTLVTTSRKRGRIYILDGELYVYSQDIDQFVAWCRANGCKLMSLTFCHYKLECRDEAAYEAFKAKWFHN